MRKLLFFPLIFLISIGATAQPKEKENPNNSPHQQQDPLVQSQEKEQMSSGDYLKKAGKQYNDAIITVSAGSALGVLFGATLSPLAGGVIAGTGSILGVISTIKANNNIKKAGKSLNENGISLHESKKSDLRLSSTRNGIGLTLSLK